MNFKRFISQKMFSNVEKVKLLLDMHSLFRNGLSPTDLVEDFIEFGEAREKLIGQDIDESMSLGEGFSLGLTGWIDDVQLQTIRMGEQAGEVADACLEAANSLKASSGALTKIIRSVTGPSIMVILTILAATALATVVFPELGAIVPRGKWPAITVFVYDFGVHMKSNFLWYTIGAAASPIVISFAMRTMTGEIRKVFDSRILFKQYRTMVAAQFLNSMASLIGSGVSFGDALSTISESANKYLKWHIREVEDEVESSLARGNTGMMLDTGLLDKREINRMKRVGSNVEIVELLQMSSKEHSRLLDSQIGTISVLLSSLAKLFSVFLMLVVFGGLIMLIMESTSSIV